jgi:hypothetical protein
MRHFSHSLLDESSLKIGDYIGNGVYSFNIRDIVPCPGWRSCRTRNIVDAEFCEGCLKRKDNWMYVSGRSGMSYCSRWAWRKVRGDGKYETLQSSTI